MMLYALYQLVIKICNSFGTAFKITGKTDPFDLIEFSGPCMSTTNTLHQSMCLAPYLPGGMVVAIAVESATLYHIVN
jgi:hypothetical protein